MPVDITEGDESQNEVKEVNNLEIYTVKVDSNRNVEDSEDLQYLANGNSVENEEDRKAKKSSRKKEKKKKERDESKEKLDSYRHKLPHS